MIVKAKHVIDLNILMFESGSDFYFNDEKLPAYKICCIPINDKNNVYRNLSVKESKHYINNKTGDIKQISEYNQEVERYRSFGVYQEEIESLTFKNIEDEIRYRRFLNDYEEVVEFKTVKNYVQFEICEVCYDTGSKYITSVWTSYGVDELNRLYSLNVHNYVKDMIVEISNKYELKYNLSDNLEYSKVEDKYFITDYKIPLKFVATLKDCKAKMLEWYEILEKEIVKINILCNGNKCSYNAKDVLEILNSIKSQLVKLKIRTIVPMIDNAINGIIQTNIKPLNQKLEDLK